MIFICFSEFYFIASVETKGLLRTGNFNFENWDSYSRLYQENMVDDIRWVIGQKLLHDGSVRWCIIMIHGLLFQKSGRFRWIFLHSPFLPLEEIESTRQKSKKNCQHVLNFPATFRLIIAHHTSNLMS